MKKATAIASVFILFITIVGYHLLFLLERVEAKRDIVNSISKGFNKHAGTIVLNNGCSLQGMQWENNNEFSWNDRMYDVVQKEWHGNKLIIVCLADDKETALIDNYIRLSTDDGNENKAVTNLWKLLNVPFLLSSTSLLSSSLTINTDNFNRSSSSALKVFREIQLPPPRVNA